MRESQALDQHRPERREQHAADARAVEREGQRHRAAPLEPGRNHGVDRGTGGQCPTRPAHHRGGEEQPGVGHAGPEHRAAAAQQPAGTRHGHQAEAPIQRRQPDHETGREQEMRGDRRRDDGDRPAPTRMQGVQEHRRSVEPDAPGEHRHQGRPPDDTPAEEGRAHGCGLCRSSRGQERLRTPGPSRSAAGGPVSACRTGVSNGWSMPALHDRRLAYPKVRKACSPVPDPVPRPARDAASAACDAPGHAGRCRMRTRAPRA